MRLHNRNFPAFQNLADELSDAKKERVKAQYYTGTAFMREKYGKRAYDFNKDVVKPYIEKIRRLMHSGDMPKEKNDN